MGQQTSKSTTPTFDRGVNSTEIRFNDPTLLQEPRSGFRVQGSGFRVQSSEFRVQGILDSYTINFTRSDHVAGASSLDP